MPTDLLSLSGISKHYFGARALSGVDLTLKAGEVHCVVGENGCGKSTLMKIIAGVAEPDPGAIIDFDGQRFSHLVPALSTALGIRVIYQDLALFPNLTVAENISIERLRGGLKLIDKGRMRREAIEAMRRLGVDLHPDRLVDTLSIADRQLVAICRALIGDTRILIMDEPTASLSRRETKALLALAGEIKRQGVTVVFISHRLEEILEIADRVTVMRDGAKVGTYARAEVDHHGLAELMTGRHYAYTAKQPVAWQGPPILAVEGLRRRGEFDGITFDLHAGEVVGIIGLLGAGRTELALSLFGLTRPDEGRIQVRGKTVEFHSNADAVRAGIAYVPEDRLAHGLILDHSIAVNIVLTVWQKVKTWGGLLSGRKQEALVSRWTSDLGIKTPDPRNAVRTLSGGNQQRVVLAKWLATAPDVLILDSPTVGVDVNAKDSIYRILNDLSERGIGIILISDEVPEVLYNSHRILVMAEGRVTHDLVAAESSLEHLGASVND